MNKEGKIYKILKEEYIKILKKKNLRGKYKIEDRNKNYEKLCIIIAGYKPYLYDVVFERIERFAPKDIDMCILSSGRYDERLSKIAEKNDWSYISSKRNCVSLIQNIAINHFKNAKYIYKLDEDIFVTEGYFETMWKTYEECNKNGDYKVGFVAPTIPINGYGNVKILQRFNLIECYTSKFEKPLFAAGSDRKIESDSDVAKFMWGHENFLPSIDQINKVLSSDEFSYDACPIRFSIGAILFTRKLWEEMRYFNVRHGTCLGLDEEQICSFCVNNSEAIIVSNNTAVGHLAFGKQNEEMKKYFIKNIDKFKINRNGK